MDERFEKNLKTIVDKAKQTADNYVISVELDIGSSDERAEVCECFKRKGFITKVSYHGQKSVQCQVTEDALEYLA